MKKIITMYRQHVNSRNLSLYNNMNPSYIRIFDILNNYKSEYFTFLLGFMSSLLIDEIHNALSLLVKENPVLFICNSLNVVVLLLINYIGIKFIISFQTIQEDFNGKTLGAKINYYLEYFNDHFQSEINKLNLKIIGLICLVITLLLINVFKFFYTNNLLCFSNNSNSVDNSAASLTSEYNATTQEEAENTQK